ncbi:MAG TPA: ABC transporter permease subunit [Dongiaceae bacterium]
MTMPQVPLAEWITAGIAWLQHHGESVFGVINAVLAWLDNLLRDGLSAVSPIVILVVVCIWLGIRGRYVAALLAPFALGLIWDLRLWGQAMDTVSLVTIACGISIILGFPLGILIAEFKSAKKIIVPVLDYMQTTPAFVYLIPAVLFFGIGSTPGILATAVFSAPAMAKAVALGLEQVDFQFIEAGEAFGASPLGILWKIKLPLSSAYIATGISQCIMMALSMVVICALIGARGLGVEVVTALSQMDLAQGIEAGFAVVLLAILLDQICRPKPGRTRR